MKTSKNLMIKKILSVLFFLFLWLFVFLIWIDSKFNCNIRVNISNWQNFQKFESSFPFFIRLKIKIASKIHWYEIPKIQVWTYVFSGECNVKQFLQKIEQWPQKKYFKYTVLEWRSQYDIDYDLSKKWYIKSWEFISYIQNNLQKIISQYEFLQKINEIHKLTSLEWFLYPETYNIDKNKPVIKQLLQHQLNTFEQRIWNRYQSQLYNFTDKLKQNWFNNLKMSPWAIINLASIIQKEERNLSNVPVVAWIFLNRLSQWIQLWADITLCYWLKIPYSKCTPSLIVKHIKDKNNLYNTRVKVGLPPTPISTPIDKVVEWVLNFKKTNYLYYLHDLNWNIHYSSTLQWHNQNKQKYLY